MINDEIFMQRALELAFLGEGKVAPNPLVGAVVVHQGEIIGEGYHQEFGGKHAEVNAIDTVKNKNLLSESTLYVSLEPCVHFGKTPPCTDLIIENKLKKVVVACSDPHEKVAGKGIERLKNAGIIVETGILEREAIALNNRFFTFHQKKRPYVFLKWAQSKDGFIDVIRNKGERQQINQISSDESKVLVHSWRNREQAILVGRITVENDNPQLTVRAISGNNPTRIIIDKDLKISPKAKVFDTEAATIVLNLTKNEIQGNITFVKLKKMDVLSMLNCLYQMNILSIMVEGGTYTIQQFIHENLWDEAAIIVGDKVLHAGLKAPEINRLPDKSFNFSSDFVHLIYNQ